MKTHTREKCTAYIPFDKVNYADLMKDVELLDLTWTTSLSISQNYSWLQNLLISASLREFRPTP
jgi:hypothetical protein